MASASYVAMIADTSRTSKWATIRTQRRPHPASSSHAERVQFGDQDFPHERDRIVRKICVPFRAHM
jgi:hypothetical protein